MSARLSTLARRWNVSLVTVHEYAFASGTHDWTASAVSDDFPGTNKCINYSGAPTREAALFQLKAAIDDARKLEVLAA
jgi:hypothetical protein